MVCRVEVRGYRAGFACCRDSGCCFLEFFLFAGAGVGGMGSCASDGLVFALFGWY